MRMDKRVMALYEATGVMVAQLMQSIDAVCASTGMSKVEGYMLVASTLIMESGMPVARERELVFQIAQAVTEADMEGEDDE